MPSLSRPSSGCTRGTHLHHLLGLLSGAPVPPKSGYARPNTMSMTSPSMIPADALPIERFTEKCRLADGKCVSSLASKRPASTMAAWKANLVCSGPFGQQPTSWWNSPLRRMSPLKKRQTLLRASSRATLRAPVGFLAVSRNGRLGEGQTARTWSATRSKVCSIISAVWSDHSGKGGEPTMLS